MLDVLHQESSVGVGKTHRIELVLQSTAIEADLREQVEVLDVGLLIQLSDLEVVQFLGQISELVHNVLHLSLVFDSRILKYGFISHSNLFIRVELHKWNILHLLALKHKSDQQLHAKPDNRFVLISLDIDLIRKSENLLQKTSLREATNQVSVRHLV